jgi:hypothetical protein
VVSVKQPKSYDVVAYQMKPTARQNSAYYLKVPTLQPMETSTIPRTDLHSLLPPHETVTFHMVQEYLTFLQSSVNILLNIRFHLHYSCDKTEALLNQLFSNRFSKKVFSNRCKVSTFTGGSDNIHQHIQLLSQALVNEVSFYWPIGGFLEQILCMLGEL